MHDRRAQLSEAEQAKGPLAVEIEDPQVVAFAQIAQHDLEMPSVTLTRQLQRYLVGDELAEPLGLEFFDQRGSVADSCDVRITKGPLPPNNISVFM